MDVNSVETALTLIKELDSLAAKSTNFFSLLSMLARKMFSLKGWTLSLSLLVP